MNILQLCCFSNLWPDHHQVTSFDISNGTDIFTIPPVTGTQYDLVAAAPPCDQWTKANNHNWSASPVHFYNITAHCISICIHTGKHWFLENPPGRILKFFPILKQYRIMTWRSQLTNKEYVIFGNFLCLQPHVKRYPGQTPISNKSKKQREAWQPDFIDFISQNLSLYES